MMDEIVPVVGLAQTVLFPGMECTLLLGTVRALGAVQEARRCVGAARVAICTATSLPSAFEAPSLHKVGVMAHVVDLKRHESGLWLAEFCAHHRVHVQQVLRDRPFRLARVHELDDECEPADLLTSLILTARHLLLELLRRAPQCTVAGPVLTALSEAKRLETQVNALMGCMALLSLEKRQGLLECAQASLRLEAIVETLEARVAGYGRPTRAV